MQRMDLRTVEARFIKEVTAQTHEALPKQALLNRFLITMADRCAREALILDLYETRPGRVLAEAIEARDIAKQNLDRKRASIRRAEDIAFSASASLGVAQESVREAMIFDAHDIAKEAEGGTITASSRLRHAHAKVRDAEDRSKAADLALAQLRSELEEPTEELARCEANVTSAAHTVVAIEACDRVLAQRASLQDELERNSAILQVIRASVIERDADQRRQIFRNSDTVEAIRRVNELPSKSACLVGVERALAQPTGSMGDFRSHPGVRPWIAWLNALRTDATAQLQAED